MKRVIQPKLQRGRVADRVSLLLLLGLLIVLVASVLHGVTGLPVS